MSRVRIAVSSGVFVVCLIVATPASLFAQTSTPIEGRPGAPAITAALDALRQDPNLGSERTIRTLRWRGNSSDAPTEPAMPGWLRRIVEWFATSSRYAVWLAALVGAALFAGYLIRVARDVDAGDDVGLVLTPSHVRDLDIRPESLPADVGAAARDLWERGEHRQAMALLYRAALSRLVHVHRVPVRDSSTEGDCLTLARPLLDADSYAYLSRLVRVWQLLVYGHRVPASDDVIALCEQFERAMAGRGQHVRGAA